MENKTNEIIEEIKGDCGISFDAIRGIDKALEMLDRHSREEIRKALHHIDESAIIQLEVFNQLENRLNEARREDSCDHLFRSDVRKIFDEFRRNVKRYA